MRTGWHFLLIAPIDPAKHSPGLESFEPKFCALLYQTASCTSQQPAHWIGEVKAGHKSWTASQHMDVPCNPKAASKASSLACSTAMVFSLLTILRALEPTGKACVWAGTTTDAKEMTCECIPWMPCKLLFRIMSLHQCQTLFHEAIWCLWPQRYSLYACCERDQTSTYSQTWKSASSCHKSTSTTFRATCQQCKQFVVAKLCKTNQNISKLHMTYNIIVKKCQKQKTLACSDDSDDDDLKSPINPGVFCLPIFSIIGQGQLKKSKT